MMKGKRLSVRLGTVLCAALTLCVLTVCVSAASVDDALKSYASELAKENDTTVGGEVGSGSRHDQYQVAVTGTGSSRSLYVIELRTATAYPTSNGLSSSSADRLDCALFYLGGDGKVYWTEEFNFTKKAAEFMGTNVLKANQTDTLSIALPSGTQSSACKKVIGIYFHKAGSSSAKAAWSADWVRIAGVSGEIGSLSESNGTKYRSYTGTYKAGTVGLTELKTADWGDHLWRLKESFDSTAATGSKVSHYLEIVTGEDGYSAVGSGGTVTIQYKDTAGATFTETINMLTDGVKLFPDSDLNGDVNNVLLSKEWMTLNTQEVTALAKGYVGNYFAQSYKNTYLSAYSATGFLVSLPGNIDEVTSITVKLNGADSVNIQSIRLICPLAATGNYLNGGLSSERVYNWGTGKLVAQTNSGTRTVSGKGSWTWTKGTNVANGLTSYTYGTRPLIYNLGGGVGITVQFADVAGAGVESLLAKNQITYKDNQITFSGKSAMKSKAGEDAMKAYHNLNPFYKESMTLEVTYKDTFGSTRRVSVPFVTTYLLCALQQNNGKLSGGSWTTWIAGILQQNENAALALRLSEYESLVSVRLTYGSAPSGMSSTNTATIDTASDSIAIESVCIYEGVYAKDDFKSTYEKGKLALTLSTSLTPSYSWTASSAQGQSFSGGSSLSLTVGSSLTAGAPPARDMTDKYVVTVTTSNVDGAGTWSDVDVSFGYTDSQGAKKTSTTYSMRTLMDGYYGDTFRGSSPGNMNTQYYYHMNAGSTASFAVQLPDAATIDSVTFSLTGNDNWQFQSVTIHKAGTIAQRTGTRSMYGSTQMLLWSRANNNAGSAVASVTQPVLLYSNNPSKTVYFTTYDSSGQATQPEQQVKTEEYMTTLPTQMTYEDTLKDLGLSVVKCNYRVDVKVSDLEDAGSTNYFYFQLVFENGTSAVVLANQQLASDSFRQGTTESFQIKTTQNYGNVTAVRIICDATASTSDVFDKLNIDDINITLSSNSGVSKTWIVEDVGWIDINYIDEGEDQGVDGLEKYVERSVSNDELIKEFAVSRTATAVDLLFCIATDATSPSGTNPYTMTFGGSFEATLVYLDGGGVQQSMNFDLTKAIQEYNDANDTRMIYRANHNDRFRLTMTDVSSITSLTISRSGGNATAWKVASVSISQIGSLGDVYLSPTLSEYYRDPVGSTSLAQSTNASGVAYSIGGSDNVTVTFTSNSIDVVEETTGEDVWSASISRVPVSETETLNISIYALDGLSFAAGSKIQAAVKYTALYGGTLEQSSFTLSSHGTVDGKSVLYAKNLSLSTMSSLRYLALSRATDSSGLPTVGKAVVQRVRDNVVMATYVFDYGNGISADRDGTVPEYEPSTSYTAPAMHQTLTLQPAEGQSRTLTAESDDVAVALRYTSSLDPASTKTVYQTPYIYLTDADYAAIVSGRLIELTFDTSYVGEVVGLSVVSTGEPMKFDSALVENYVGEQGSTSAVLQNSASFASPFTATTMATSVDATADTVVPVTFRFTTAAESTAMGAGTSGTVGMSVEYKDNSGSLRTAEIANLLRYIADGTQPTAGSTVELTLLLPDVSALESVTLSVNDSWFLTGISAELSKAAGTETITTTVNNWVRSGEPLTVSFTGSEVGNYIQSFSVSAQSSVDSAAASAGNTLLIEAAAGTGVRLTPAVTAVGSPDTTWTWNAGDYSSALTVKTDGTATFMLPSGLNVGDTRTISVSSNADRSLTVTVTVKVVEEPMISIDDSIKDKFVVDDKVTDKTVIGNKVLGEDIKGIVSSGDIIGDIGGSGLSDIRLPISTKPVGSDEQPKM